MSGIINQVGARSGIIGGESISTSGNIATTGSGTLTVAGTSSLQGVVTKPNQPFFACEPTSSYQSINNGDVVNLLWSTVSGQDIGSHFTNSGTLVEYASATTSFFTAPVDGKYLFQIMVLMDNLRDDFQYAELRLRTTQESEYVHYRSTHWQATQDTDPPNHRYDTFNLNVIAYMDENDHAWTTAQCVDPGSDVDQTQMRSDSHWSGVLLT